MAVWNTLPWKRNQNLVKKNLRLSRTLVNVLRAVLYTSQYQYDSAIIKSFVNSTETTVKAQRQTAFLRLTSSGVDFHESSKFEVGCEKPSCRASRQSLSNIITLHLFSKKLTCTDLKHQPPIFFYKVFFSFYLSVHIVEEDNETEWTSCHGLSWDEGVLEGGLSLGLHHSVQRQSCELQKKHIIKTQIWNCDTVSVAAINQVNGRNIGGFYTMYISLLTI